MISYNYETGFELNSEEKTALWLSQLIRNENYQEGDINYIFCDDDYLLKMNIEFLDHDTLTDIISFDYKVGKELHGDIFISIDRIKDNAADFNTAFDEELHRVMAHGLLHFCGYKDKTSEQSKEMRIKEDFYLHSWSETFNE